MSEKIIICLMFLVSVNISASTPMLNTERMLSSLILNSSPEIQHHHKVASEALEGSLSQEAIEAVIEVEDAIRANGIGEDQVALRAITKASEKINQLLTGTPKQAISPVDFELQIINFAPKDMKAIKEVRKQIDVAYKRGDFPESRSLLESLMSEIYVRTYSLPIVSFSEKLKEASLLIDQKKNTEAGKLLSSSLNSLIIQEWRIPLPFIEAESHIIKAEISKVSDSLQMKKSLELAQEQLERAWALGYVANDKESFDSLKRHIKELQNQIKNKEKRLKDFGIIRDYLLAFINHHRAPQSVIMGKDRH